jgi:OFA family oxalate/formate antiporter-like MFS transporter
MNLAKNAPAHHAGRWVQLVAGVICMSMIANLQYGWTLFVDPIDQKYHWGTPAIQLAFTVFVATETWLVPIEGWFVDRFGPRIVVAIGSVFVALGWMLYSMASSLDMLYAAAVVSGIGAGAVYGTCVGNALKWFPEHRGLAAGLTAAGFGAGAALTVIPIRATILAYGYETAFLWAGIIQAVVVLVLSQVLVAPAKGEVHSADRRLQQSSKDCTPSEMVRTPIFWILYFMFVMVASSGLMAAAQIAPIAKDLKLADQEMTFLFVTATTLSIVLVVDNVLNGLARPFFGYVSDRFGRENTMAVVFTLGAASYWGLGNLATTPTLFVLFAGLVFFTWGEIFSLFPATCADLFGSRYATTNAGLLYTAKGTAAFFVPLASILRDYTGSWNSVFAISAAMNLIVAAGALFVLKPLHRRKIAGEALAMEPA